MASPDEQADAEDKDKRERPKKAKEDPRLGWYASKRRIFGRQLIVLATPAVQKRGILITRPNTGTNNIPKEKSEFLRTYMRL
eukprot:CAMPEP_0206325680 /NCGR_PEP_ID=MMETSP0106_2-20121207/21205_1 /ASSEMBLY_ACC=CAM_ASM_000206 /TAXON_ID=81532 /ORGANISM="Acanthoeca-like sp., Strain 10tr" /LENGTH=81 /DNA_ID=CAMNT_0053758169 /DNA_START=18 /DNA_END=260 /DNA_ORIENTATION=+